jgi:hypothetical protein
MQYFNMCNLWLITGWFRSSALNFYSGSARFESRRGHRLSQWLYRYLGPNVCTAFRSGHDLFLHRATPRCTVSVQIVLLYSRRE